MNLKTTLVALAIAPIPSNADSIDGSDPWRIMQLTRDEGYKATLEETKDGAPKISGRISQTSYSVNFFGCDDEGGCNSIQFSAGYDLDDGTTLSVVNDWNREKRFGSAFIDHENDPFLQFDINTDFGITEKNFRDNLDYWRLPVEQFEDHIEW